MTKTLLNLRHLKKNGLIKKLTLPILAVMCVSQASADIDTITAAAYSGDAPELQASLTSAATDYERSYGLWRLASLSFVQGQPADTQTIIVQGVESLAGKEDAESLSLLASLYGIKIALEPHTGSVYGAKIGKLMSRAQMLAPNNPRVKLFKAVQVYHTPAAFGGGSASAYKWIEQAVALFENEADMSGLQWGYADSLVWRGVIAQSQGDLGAAVADWQRALEVQPQYQWPSYLLTQAQL